MKNTSSKETRTAPGIGLPAISAICLLSIGCTAGSGQEPAAVGMANPASTHCIDKGGKLEIRKDANGNAVGMCHLPDGSVIEEWALFRKDHPRPEG
ncbi:putative hemolysin [Thauera linaloolentis]|uniref:DUF333 domain-containing protein n=1 Tax=Thauera linaloolentis (strain DSM 12138 / JCM 21573 / CCUG 41526 / CIP 105981 / IAM 15112 / NBRC 102519 / 47Lol) TaxID=1123367 RepID=N6YYZ4_THAL4|nr:DUF333 domain-containing protein [Thauera linaloolentis]ENO87343.1 hypothetical protein C666_11140 [Thauera linaloolentis 47Lol = DSM 12138]MCM8565457.1 DUF333 domain-containing protein [Thauera linaloolentis]